MYNEPGNNDDYGGAQPSYTPPQSSYNTQLPPMQYGRYGYDRGFYAPPPPRKRSKWPLFFGVLLGFIAGVSCLFIALMAWNDWDFSSYNEERNRPMLITPRPYPTPFAANENGIDITTPAPELGGGTAKLEIVPVIPVSPAPAQDGEGRPILTSAQIYEKAGPSVVCIIVEDMKTHMSGSGSGIVMTEDGYIITNNHVISNVTSIEVVMHDKERYPAKLVGYDQASDLAVIKIEAKGLIPAEFGDSDALRVGDPVIVIGNPLGLELQNTATSGMISAINRDIQIERRVMTTIQTDASVNQGNSGGPMLNRYGQVVGIISSKVMSTYTGNVEGLGFAIPITPAKEIIDDLVKYGYVSGRPTIGVTVQEIPASPALGTPLGVLVVGISENCDAYKQGLRVNDIITELDGEAATNLNQLEALKNKHGIGDKITLTVYRGGETLKITFELMDAGILNQ